MNIRREITSGLRCKTYIVEENKNVFVYQEYKDSAYYQAKKKYDILKKIQENNYSRFIPKCYKYSNLNNKSVLYTELKNGESLSKVRNNKKDFPLSKIAKEFSETLYKIHSIKDSDCFGWITDNGCIGQSSLLEFVENEIERVQPILEKYISAEDFSSIKEKEEHLREYVTRLKNIKPQLIWYDLNPENILIDDDKLSGIVDPGGAKYAIKELDFAFIKMEICNNDNDFQAILSEYKKMDTSVDEKLIDMMGILVELDDIMLRLNENIFIPIPYCSNFRKIICKYCNG